MDTYIIPMLIFAALGLGAGVLLTVVSKAFEVEIDERIEKINEILPAVNCGACGYVGCAEYAAAIVEKNVDDHLCKPGGGEVYARIGEILGRDNSGEFTHETAVVLCNGDCDAAPKKFVFDGIANCHAAKRFYGGDGGCTYGCMGYGDCAEKCVYGAISIINGLAVIDRALCKACELCVSVCPNNLIALQPVAMHVNVKCSSGDNPKATRQKCKNGCIGCKLCEKKLKERYCALLIYWCPNTTISF